MLRTFFCAAGIRALAQVLLPLGQVAKVVVAAVTIEGAAGEHWSDAKYDRWLSEAQDVLDLMQREVDAVAGARAVGGKPRAVA